MHYVAPHSSEKIQNKKFLINVEKYNKLEKKPEDVEKLNVFLKSSQIFWKAECSRLIKELNLALVKCKRVNESQLGAVLSTSDLDNRRIVSQNCRSTTRDCSCLTKKFIEMNVPRALSVVIYNFAKNCGAHTHQFVSKVCDAKCVNLIHNLK